MDVVLHGFQRELSPGKGVLDSTLNPDVLNQVGHTLFDFRPALFKGVETGLANMSCFVREIAKQHIFHLTHVV